MTLVRRDIWHLGTEDDPWDPIVLGYARAVAAMQDLPITDARSWRYQAAIHGNVDTQQPAGAPWNECQHQSWFFLPWHRMYLFHFEKIVASFLPADVRDDWALPYWDYSNADPDDPSHALPPAFRAPRLPDGDDNPLFVPDRRTAVNNGVPLAPAVYDIAVADAEPLFTGGTTGGSAGFGGPQTGFFHGGPDGTFGVLETTPHGSVHVSVGGRFGLMRNPDTAALDPIFWLHHANIDRLWATWDLDNTRHPTTSAWLDQKFELRDATGTSRIMTPRHVRDIVTDLDYTYESLPATLEVQEAAVTPGPTGEPRQIGQNADAVVLDRAGASAEIAVGAMPAPRAAAEAGDDRLYLNLADIRGDRNPGVVYGVYLNLPPEGEESTPEDHRAGVVSFFGIELTAPGTRAGREEHGMRYSFEVTGLVDRLRARGDWDPARLRVTLAPLPEADEDDDGDPETPPTVEIGTVSLYAVPPA